MWAYWLLFLVPVGIAFSPIKGDKNVKYMIWAIVGLLTIYVVGFRYQVGGDWGNYLQYLEWARLQSDDLSKVLAIGYANGSAYMLLNWVALQLGLGIYFVNALCAAVLVVGLTKYCRQQPIPWLALAVAMPYLVAVVAMAYTRQAVALGLLFWGLSILRAGNERKFFSLIMLGSLFHLSAIINLFYLVLTREKILRRYYLFFGLFIVGLLFLFVRLDVLQGYQSVFLYTLSIHSQGGVIRAIMNVLPVIVSLFFWSRIKRISPDYKIIKWMAIAALLSLPLLSLSTTMVDRFALYLIPLQVALWPRLIAVQKTMLMRSIVASTILAYYGSVLFIWFNFAVNAHNWLPYRLWPFTSEPIYVPIF